MPLRDYPQNLRRRGYVERTTDESGSSSSAARDIPGMSISFVAPVNGIVRLKMRVPAAYAKTTAGNITLAVVTSANNSEYWGYAAKNLLVGSTLPDGPLLIDRRITGLTPAATYTWKMRVTNAMAGGYVLQTISIDAIALEVHEDV